ncbi:MAG: type I 3-dehydroquinate dehydratase [Clostridia bacterium]|nr:type I 3-dehydroquinate dehydratase [Clostridia bacterium]
MNTKPTFLGHHHPLLCCMIQTNDPEDAIVTVRNAAYDGCDAYGFQYCKIDPKFRTQEKIQRVFRYMEDKPIYVTNYRTGFNKGVQTDEELGEGLVQLASWGATLCDVMGDLYAPHPLELTEDAAAIDKQRRLIDRIHEAGGEVLMSSHVLKYTPAEEVLRIAHEQVRRGADVVKIVTAANSTEEELENLRITHLLAKELETPFLFLSGGSHNKLHRTIGPMLGCCMYLCVQQYDRLATKSQPILRSVRQILNNFDYKPERKL